MDNVRVSLRCPVGELAVYAARYSFPGEELAVAAGVSARARGHYTKDEFVLLRRWKSPRGVKLAERIPADLIEEATALAFAAMSEEIRLAVLTALPSVGVPVASALLHLGHRDPYPLIDFRALWTLGLPNPRWYSFSTWMNYVGICRALSDSTGMTMRDLDRALWQYSSENQPPR